MIYKSTGQEVLAQRYASTVTKYHPDGAFKAKLPLKIEKIQFWVFICIVGISILTTFIHSKCHTHDQGMPHA